MVLLNNERHQNEDEVLKNSESFVVRRISGDETVAVETLVARELPLTIILNDEELVTLLCSPEDLESLAVGFLWSEGLINSKDDIQRITVDDRRGVVRVNTTSSVEMTGDMIFKRIISSGCGRGASFYSIADTSNEKVTSRKKISSDEVFSLVREFQHGSKLYKDTHGVHSAALCDNKHIIVFKEDIGRHNAIDKIFGKCLLEDIETKDRLVITTGRITSEILHKVAKRGIPILVSISAPTNLGINIAKTLGITLIALVRGKKMNAYTVTERLTLEGEKPEKPDQ